MIRRSIVVSCVALAVTASVAASAPLAAASPDDTSVITNASQGLVKAGSARFTGNIVAVSKGTSTTNPSRTITFSGAFDFKHHNGQFTIDASAWGTGPASGRIAYLLVNDVVYVSTDSFTGLAKRKLPSMFAGKKWLKLDANGLGWIGAQSLAPTDPSNNAAILGGTTSVENVGTETVGGAPTTHYRVQIDLAKALQVAPTNLQPDVKRGIAALGGSGTAGVWVDSQGRLRRLSLFDTQQQSGTAKATETVEFSNFGTSVNVTTPPADEVLDFNRGSSRSGSGSTG